MLLEISKIKVNDRIRKDFGNIEELAADIKENGLINPIVVTPEFQLIAGERRLKAHQLLNLNQVPGRIMEITDYEHQLRLEISENEHRKEFSFSERVEWAKRLEQVEKIKAKDRMAAKENFPDPAGQVRDIVAEQAGFGSGKQYDKAKFISENATPEIIQQLDAGLISTHKAFVETKEKLERLEAALIKAEDRAEQFEMEKMELQQQYKNAVPTDQLEDAIAEAIERRDDENTVFLKQKEKEAEQQLKQRDDYWKNKLKDDLESERLKVDQLKSGYQRAKDELEALKLAQPNDFNQQQSEIQMKKMKFEADTNTIQFSIHVKQFLQKAGITSFMLGAIASASNSEKKRLGESLDMLDAFVEQLRPAINSRKVVEKNVIS